jgi:hypothetical protein
VVPATSMRRVWYGFEKKTHLPVPAVPVTALPAARRGCTVPVPAVLAGKSLVSTRGGRCKRENTLACGYFQKAQEARPVYLLGKTTSTEPIYYNTTLNFACGASPSARTSVAINLKSQFSTLNKFTKTIDHL